MRVLAHAKVLGAAVLKPAGDLVFDFFRDLRALRG